MRHTPYHLNPISALSNQVLERLPS